MKGINKVNHYTPENFLTDAKDYINAIKSGRMFCIIESVSASGMSRVIKFHSFQGTTKHGYYRQYWCFFRVLGYTQAKNSDGFRINGCGMDMIFHTNYTIIHDLKKLGLITPEECGKLAQQTPTKL
jgi:hypothetical protein